MHVLLVEPNYYTRFPPIGLLKLSSYHRQKGDSTELVRGCVRLTKRPDRIYITSLFTWAWKPVWKAVIHYKVTCPGVETWLGGIYASLLPDHARLSGADRIWTGLFPEAEDLMPDYELVPEWDGSILFTSRGCIRRCGFCSVPKLEGPPNSLKYSIRHLIYPKHTRVILFDNNILGVSNWRAILDELAELGLKVDFNQGLDARCVTEEVAEKISKLKMDVVRLAYDLHGVGPFVERAIERLSAYGARRRDIIIYTLFNYVDDPQDFFERVRDTLTWEAVSYPMRYEPLCTLEKGKYVSPKWNPERLEMVTDARRVLGYGGAFPPYRPLVQKFRRARDFDEAFSLRLPSGRQLPVRPGKKHYFAGWRREADWRKVPALIGR